VSIEEAAFRTASRKPVWPEGFELAWDGLDGELRLRPGSAARMLPLEGAENFREAIEAAEKRQELYASKVTKYESKAKYIVVLTTEGRLAVIEVRRLTRDNAELTFSKRKISFTDGAKGPEAPATPPRIGRIPAGLEKQLAAKYRLDFDETPVTQVVDFLQAITASKYELLEKDLDLKTLRPVTIDVEVSLQEALDLL
jgi:hypothetical protein